MKNTKTERARNNILKGTPLGERRLKICGMKYPENILEVAALQPDYLGFIFYEKSKRNFEGIIPEIPKSIKKVGVFVNEMIEIVVSLIEEYDLAAVQLHGDESPAYIQQLKNQIEDSRSQFRAENKNSKKKRKMNQQTIEIIKVFSVADTFHFEVLQPYEALVNYFLFDTKGKERGGNGATFNWNVLKAYPSTKPYFLSGGVGVESSEVLLSFLQNQESKYCYAIDVNSKFEIKAGLKSVEKIKEFKSKLVKS